VKTGGFRLTDDLAYGAAAVRVCCPGEIASAELAAGIDVLRPKARAVISISTAVAVFRMVKSMDKDTLSQVLTALAGSEARAAAQAIRDSRASRYPRDQLISAATLLRSAHQKYLDAAQRPLTIAERLAAKHDSTAYKDEEKEYDATRREKARFDAAVTAVALAGVYMMIEDHQQALAWKDRARPLFTESYRRIPKLKLSTVRQVGSYPVAAPSSSDISRYRDECDELQREFDGALDSII
jgi:hypothetical protein